MRLLLVAPLLVTAACAHPAASATTAPATTASAAECVADADCADAVSCSCGLCPGSEPTVVTRGEAERQRRDCDEHPRPPVPCSPCPQPPDPVPYYQPSCRAGRCRPSTRASSDPAARR